MSPQTLVYEDAGGTEVTLREGDWVSLNGTSGEVIRGRQQLVKPQVTGGDLGRFMRWGRGGGVRGATGN